MKSSTSLDPTLLRILQPAYPCPEFTDTCKEWARWCPTGGHVPRGFLGACGNVSEVELVFVLAEPGDPYPGEKHDGLDSAYNFLLSRFRAALSVRTKNLRSIIDSCWPRMPLDKQMTKVWITNSVLCSASEEGGTVPRRSEKLCGERYLLKEIAVFQNGLVIALGGKAARRLRALGITDFSPVGAVTLPGCNFPKTRASWQSVPTELQKHRRKHGLR